MSKFEDDKLKNEKGEPKEGSNFNLINIHFGLLMMLIGHGATYLFLETESTKLGFGDSRTINPIPEIVKTNDIAVETKTRVDEKKEYKIVKIDLKQGQKIYKRSCKTCHQADGMGVSGAFPPLGGSHWVNGSKERLASIVILGLEGKIHVRGEDFEGNMPSFKNNRKFKKKTENFAHVLSYIRNSFGNSAGNIDVETIKKTLKRWSDRDQAINGQEELDKIEWGE